MISHFHIERNQQNCYFYKYCKRNEIFLCCYLFPISFWFKTDGRTKFGWFSVWTCPCRETLTPILRHVTLTVCNCSIIVHVLHTIILHIPKGKFFKGWLDTHYIVRVNFVCLLREMLMAALTRCFSVKCIYKMPHHFWLNVCGVVWVVFLLLWVMIDAKEMLHEGVWFTFHFLLGNFDEKLFLINSSLKKSFLKGEFWRKEKWERKLSKK